MGKNRSWFSSLKKTIGSSKGQDSRKASKSKKKSFGKQNYLDADSPSLRGIVVPPPVPQPEEIKLTQSESEQNKYAYSVAVTTTAAAGAAAEVVPLTSVSQFDGKPKEEVGAVKIQAAFRGYLARRAFRALQGLVRLKSLVEQPSVKRQTANALRCMQTLARVQSQIRSRRMRILEENQALQRQLLQKHAKELENLQMGDEWDDSLQSKEQIEANLLSKYEAAMRRERALAYAFSHQQTLKNSSRTNPMFMDPINPHWGWSWLERLMAASRSMTEKEINNDHSSIYSTSCSLAEGEITRAYARHQLNSIKISPAGTQKPCHPTSHQSPSTKTTLRAVTPSVARKLKPASPRGCLSDTDDDSKSMVSMQSQSEQYRRHSIGGLSVRDDESLASSPGIPSYMVPTKSAKAKSRLPSPLGAEKNGPPEKRTAGSAKKQLSFPALSATAKPRRHSGPPNVSSSVISVQSVKNGGVN
ncbi:protein IQ-DOMAIN 2-like [Malania oleifera]|uniref:protein IQ-DOMAIN 2-like n=1 Tax=Malania oleifera TaxID=397392 RepID=UPI0025AE63F7|nr:protein IQ-DOMAIN 2-like [Malania oleifera]XP_057983785.1 protein IQ-DOMAIN 2-like [Malania oleifera]XP_057983786.1 protein IQ-DOMAIN 2-like [Malania oleifera]